MPTKVSGTSVYGYVTWPVIEVLEELNQIIPASKVHGANMGPTWGPQDPGGPHAGHMYLAIWDVLYSMVAGEMSWCNHMV